MGAWSLWLQLSFSSLLTACSRAYIRAGDAKRQPSEWASLPAQILGLAFEVQPQALDNCAAACSCKTWQAAVRCTLVKNLHLHASKPSEAEQWKSFLSSRTFVDKLQLTGAVSSIDFLNIQGDQLKHVVLRSGVHLKTALHGNTLANVPDLRHLSHLETLDITLQNVDKKQSASTAAALCLLKCPNSLAKLCLTSHTTRKRFLDMRLTVEVMKC